MFTDFFKNLWMKMFGTIEWLGLNIGFWMSMLAVVLLVVIMVVVFWSVKPKKNKDDHAPEKISHDEGDDSQQ